jgi:hypothetical protein
MNEEMPEGLTGEWLDEFMRRALPHVLSKCAEAKPVVVADLVQLECEMFPSAEVKRQVIWVDNLDEEIEEEERLDDAA